MNPKVKVFESGHPDTKESKKISNSSASQSTAILNSGALGALDILPSFELGVEIPNLKQKEEMIKSVVVKDHNRNTAKRWYVEYRELDTEKNKWIRKREYGFVNKEKDPDKRTELITRLCQEIMSSLVTRISATKPGDSEILRYMNAYINDKRNSLKKTSIKNIKSSLGYFYSYLQSQNLHTHALHEIRKQHLQNFRIAISQKTGNRSVNNHIAFIKSFFNYYIDNFENVIFKNPCQGLKKLPSMSESHIAYSDSQVKEYFKYLQDKDPMLLLYCKFVGLAFVRCEEARNLKVGDIDFTRRTITLWAGYSKTRMRKVKPLLDTFYDILIQAGIYKYPSDCYIFSYGGQPGIKQVHYNYFRKRFKKLKTKFNLNPKYTIYSFRHTYVSQLLDNGAKWHEVMKYTGHTTMEAFAQYARSLHVKPAEDLSRFLNV